MMQVNNYSKFGITFTVTSLFWLYIFAMAIHAIMPVNPITRLPLQKEINIPSWFPQGWGFFSKDPRDPYFSVVNISDSALAVAWPNSLPENYFGLNRYGRSQGIEAGLLISKVPEKDQSECKESPYLCLTKSKVAMELENTSPDPTICGDIGFIFQEPIPWAWSKNGKKIEMPSKIVRVSITCFKK